MKIPAVTKAIISIALATMSLSIQATTLNTELLVNGNAETGDTTGWNANGIETVSTSVPGQLAVPVGSSIGNWSFQGGLGSATSQTLSQSVHLDDLSALIAISKRSPRSRIGEAEIPQQCRSTTWPVRLQR